MNNARSLPNTMRTAPGAPAVGVGRGARGSWVWALKSRLGTGRPQRGAEGRRGALPSGSIYSYQGCGARDCCPSSIPRCPSVPPEAPPLGAPQPAAATPRLLAYAAAGAAAPEPELPGVKKSEAREPSARVFQLENEYKSTGKFGPTFRMAPTTSLFTLQSEVSAGKEFVLIYPIELCTPTANLRPVR